jgi:hypothetical protein
MVRSFILILPSSFYTMLLLTLLLSNNRVHGFGSSSVSMNNPLLSSRMVTQGYSLLTRTHSERNDKAFLPWNMARTPTTTHAHADADADADADAEGPPAFGNSHADADADTEGSPAFGNSHADADADADAEGSPAFGNYGLMEMMRSMLETQKEMEAKVDKMLETQEDISCHHSGICRSHPPQYDIQRLP